MSSLRFAVQANQAYLLPAFLLVKFIQRDEAKPPIQIDLQDSKHLAAPNTYLEFQVVDSETYRNTDVLPHLLQESDLIGSSEGPVWEWLHRTAEGGGADLTTADFKRLGAAMQQLNAHLTLRSYVVGYSLSVADIAVWAILRGNKVAYANIKRNNDNVARWFTLIEATNPWIAPAILEMNAIAQHKRAIASAEGGSYDIGLGYVEGGVVTRFPPEPSGYLHIGHAKAALLNDYFAHEKSTGTLICRFDDTNPSKESEEFQDSILADLGLMKVFPDRVSHSSDYFQQIQDYCLKLLRMGRAYADNTDHELMKAERRAGIKSKCRDIPISSSLQHFEEMKLGSDEGVKWCIRAKISVDDENKSLRDPVIYRCNLDPHHRTGRKWKAYPTYDLCAPILDSLEGVTHALRTNEYRDRNPQYAWIQKALGLRPVEIFDFARVSFIRTVLSKRKLTEIVNRGVVSGWLDPRMPTVRGIHRRGMLMDTLREFMIKQGPSSNIVNQDWTQIWALNKKKIDPIAPRHTAVIKADMVEAFVNGAAEVAFSDERPKHAKNPAVGFKNVVFSKKIILDQEDALSFDDNEEITLMNWGNAIVGTKQTSPNHPANNKPTITHLELDLHLEGDLKKTKKKITWLSSDQDLIPCELCSFDHLITKDKLEKDKDKLVEFLTPQTEFRTEALADCNVTGLMEGDIIQFERKGYYRVDRPFQQGRPAVMFEIPVGKTNA